MNEQLPIVEKDADLVTFAVGRDWPTPNNCYVQSHGCGRGCSTAGHPGTRITGRPNDPRSVTA